jgi:hypothetical protein
VIAFAQSPGNRIIKSLIKGKEKNLKKVLPVCLSILFMSVFVPRQAAAEVTFDFGIKGGISFAKTAETSEGEDFPSTALKSPVFGVFAAINLNKMFTFQPEAYLLTQGGIWEEDVELSLFKWEHKAKYIHIPLLAKVHLIQEGKVVPIIYAGPAVDLLLSANEKFWIDGALEYDESFKEYLRTLHFGAVFGGGVEFRLEKLMFILEARYNLGLANTIKDPEPGISYKYRTLMVLAGIGF